MMFAPPNAAEALPRATRVLRATPAADHVTLDYEGRFLRRHLPEIAHLDNTLIHAPWRAGSDIDCHGYPPPIVEHAVQREQAITLFAAAKAG